LNWRIIGTVLAKELKETLRDRRTLFIMVVIPVLLYPAMLVLMEQLAMFGQRSLEANVSRVAVVGETGAAATFLERDGSLVLVHSDTVPLAALQSGRVDAIVVFPQAAWSEQETNQVRVIFDGTQDRSSHARGMVTRRLGEWGEALLVQRLEQQGLPRSYAVPLAVEETSVASAEQMGGYALGRVLPMLLILMTVLGAFYPSIDMAAGEKERGTLETLLTAPVPADLLVMGKFVAAGLMGFIAASLNLLSMLLTFQSGILQFGDALDLQFHLPLHSILIVAAVLMLLSILFSALFLGIAVRSHSFKEAQNSLTPVYIIAILPAVLAMLPGLDFTPVIALVPVAGVAFLFRDLMGGQVALEAAVIAVCATIFYAMVALVFAARAFGREDILFGSGGGAAEVTPLRARFRAWRRAPRTLPTAGEALLLVVFIGLLFFYVGRTLMLRFGEQGIWISQLLLLAVPTLIFLVIARKDLRASLALRPAPPRALAAALLIVLGGIPIGWLIVWLQSFVIALPIEFLQAMEQLMNAQSSGHLLWLLLAVAVAPAICEELVFRGTLLQGFSRTSMWRAVLLSALVFGAFHLSFETAIRFLPTAWLGLLLGYVVWHTRSLYTSMLMHLVNNGLVVLLVSVPALRSLVADPSGQPPWLLVAAAPFLLWAGLRLLPRREIILSEGEPAAVRHGTEVGLAGSR
jgi:sodium transport system permease protein